jgi:hypothetical protein
MRIVSMAKSKTTGTSRTIKKSARTSNEARSAPGTAASRLIDERIRTLGDWRGETLTEVRRLIHDADPQIVEECKWFKPSNPRCEGVQGADPGRGRGESPVECPKVQTLTEGQRDGQAGETALGRQSTDCES